MIEEIKVYQMVCDGCGAFHEYDGMIVHFAFEHEAEFSAKESDWKNIDGKWYCPLCYERYRFHGTIGTWSADKKEFGYYLRFYASQCANWKEVELKLIK